MTETLEDKIEELKRTLDFTNNQNSALIKERDRYKAGLEDMAKYCCYPSGAQQAAKVLDLTAELVRTIPRT